MKTSATEKIIVIEAQVERDYEPDMFRLTIRFSGMRDDKAACVQTYNADCSKVQAALVEAGIPADAIKNSDFAVTIHYEWLYKKDEAFPEYYRRIKRIAEGYEYQATCSVEHKMDSSLLNNIWNALKNLEGDFSFDISYELEHPDECEKELLRAAVAEARCRAEVLANASDAKLGEVASIHYRFNRASNNYPTSSRMLKAESAFDSLDEELEAPTFNPESIGVYCSVSISWMLE